MAQLNFKAGSYNKTLFDGSTTTLGHQEGTLYLAKANDFGKAYLFYDNGTNYLNIMPELLGELNGGTGVDLTTITPYSVIIQNKDRTKLTGVSPTVGAFYVDAKDTSPKFGTLPVSLGGTGATTFAAESLLIGNGTSAIKTLAIGTKGYLVGSTGTTPAYVNLNIAWTAGTTAGPVLNLHIKNGSTTLLTHTAAIPVASASASGVVTTTTQTFAGAKTFSNDVNIGASATLYVNRDLITSKGVDAYYNSSTEYADGDISVGGGIKVTKNLRVDGGNIQFSKEAKISYNSTKDCFNFVFPS